MVVIEVEETNTVNPPKTKSKSRSASTSVNANRDASDGFETASDAELPSDGDDEDYNNDGEGARNIGEQQQPQGELEHETVAPQAQSEGTLNDDNRKQKALAQANDAKLQGNKLFGNGQYEEALLQYELALQFVPAMPSSVELRSICHANRAICFLKLGKYDETVKECTKALELNPTYMKALIRRGEAYEKLERFEEAIVDLKKILELDPSNDQARKTIHRLEPLAEEKREKMKEEMIGLPLSQRQDIGEMPPRISYDFNMHKNTLCAEGLKRKRIESSMRFLDAQVFMSILFLPMNIWCFLFALLMYLSQMFCFGFVLCILTLELYMFDLTCQK